MLIRITIKKYWRYGVALILFSLINVYPYITENKYLVKKHNDYSYQWFYINISEKPGLEEKKKVKLKREETALEDYKSTFILQKKMYNDYVRYNSPKSPSYKEEYRERSRIFNII